MDVTELLLSAFRLLGVGMTFVFSFLGLLFIAVKLLERYASTEQPATPKNTTTNTASTVSTVSPKAVAAITAAVQQYRKTKSV